MIKISHIRYYLMTLAVLLGMLVMVGCVRDDESDIPAQTSKEVLITVKIPDAEMPSTGRSMTEDQENVVQNIDLIIFDASDPSNEIFLEWARGVRASQSGSNVTFTASLTPTEVMTRIVVVVNTDIESIVTGFIPNVTDKKTVMEALTYSTPGSSPSDWMWPADGKNYQAIPMYGEKLISQIKPQMPHISGIMLTRMLARIDIVNSTSAFIVEDVYLVNYNTAGYVAPAWEASTGQVIDPSPDDPLIPVASGKKTGYANAIRYEVNGEQRYEAEIYAYEAPAAVDDQNNNDASSRKDAVCLVIKGRNGSSGTSYYYRVDFTEENPTLPYTKYIALKRNYKYIIDIEHVGGIGYASVEEAVRSYTVMSNLKTRVIFYSRSVIKDAVYNGQYMLGVEASEINLRKESSYNTVRVFTDNPNGWKATVTSDWLKFINSTVNDNVTTGVANDDNSSLTFYVDYFNATPEQSRTAEIVLTADRLTHKVVVTQTGKNPATLKITDENGNPIDRLDFSFHSLDAEVPAQKIFVTWTGAKEVRIHRSSSATMEYEYITPDIVKADYDHSVYEGGIQSFTFKPTKGTDDNMPGRWDYIGLYIFDTDGTWETLARAELNMGQTGALIEAVDVKTSGYVLGGGVQHSFTVKSNSPWRVSNIEVTGNAASTDLLVSGGSLSIGATGGPAVAGTEQLDVLTFKVGRWVKGRNGIVKITFENPEGSQKFYKKIVSLNLNSMLLDYTDIQAPLFYVYPYGFPGTEENMPETMTLAAAQAKCASVGDGLRIPLMSELLNGYVYRYPLGRMNYQTDYGWYWGHTWSNSYRSDSQYMTIDMGNGYSGWNTSGTPLVTRCVYVDPEATGSKYPYVQERADGPVIISRDASGGVQGTGVFPGTTAPAAANEQDDTNNRVASKLQIANSDENTAGVYYSWAEANAKCAAKGTGWRLPTQREAMLIWAMGGVKSEVYDPVSNNTYPGVWPASYNKMNSSPYVYWLKTEYSNDANKAWTFTTSTLIVDTALKTEKGMDEHYIYFGGVRCVRSVE